jgi:hypothetical protein
MAADSTRYQVDGGIWECSLAGRRLTFEFGRKQAAHFSRANGRDPIGFLMMGGSTDIFLVECIQACLSQNKDDADLVADDEAVMDLLDEADKKDDDHDEEMMKFAFMYLWALGRPRKQREQALRGVDRLWAQSRLDQEYGESPFLLTRRQPSKETSSSSGSPPPPESSPGTFDGPEQTAS